MYSPEAISRDINSNLMYSSSNHGFKHGFIDGGSFFKSKETLGSSSDLFQTQNQNQNHHQQQNSGLMRYRSAPSSYFANYLDGYNTPPPATTTTTTNNNSSSNNGDSSESESIFSALMNNCSEIEPSNDLMSQRHHHHNQVLQVSSCPMKLEMNEVQSNPQQQLHQNNGNGNGFSCADNNSNNDMVQIGGYQAAVSAGGGTVVGSYTVPVGMENQLHMRINNSSSSNNNNNSGNRSNLIRQSSSPAGFFSGFNVMRGEVGKFSINNGETSSSNSGLNFASGPPCSSSSRYMPSIAEHGNETVEETASPDNNVRLGNLNETSTTTMAYPTGFSTESWTEPAPPPPAAPPAFSILKRNRDGDFKMFSDFNRLENQDGETRNHSHTLTHHLSLPKTAGEMAVIEKYLQFQQDSVPCKIRAKRGCATHPRSIAERVRRTRISERMKKLQELFPNMDKQTNTADMLDLAVEYIKDLQNEVQTLTETRAKCKCSSKPTPSPNAKA